MRSIVLFVFFVLILGVQVHAMGMGENSNMTGINIATGSTKQVEVFLKNDAGATKTVQFFVTVDKTGLLVNGVAQYTRTITLTPLEEVDITFDVKALHADTYTVSWGYKQVGNFMGNRVQKQFHVDSFGADVSSSTGSTSSSGSSASSSGGGGSSGGSGGYFVPSVKMNASNSSSPAVASADVVVQDIAPNEGSTSSIQVGVVEQPIEQSSLQTIVTGGQKAVEVMQVLGFKLLPQTARQRLLGEIAIIAGMLALGSQLLLKQSLAAEVRM